MFDRSMSDKNLKTDDKSGGGEMSERRIRNNKIRRRRERRKNILLFEENGCYSSSPFGSYEALDILGIKPLSNNCCTYKMSKCEFKNFIELVYSLNKCSYQWIKDFVNCLKYIKDDEKVLLYISY